MHMADALVSPAVGGAMWVVSGALIASCARTVRRTAGDRLVPMMGVMGAFVFAAQMINFSIPGTGSSGHLGGGLLLAVLLGPHAAFLVMASVLTVQALFFADGGLLALGCNMFNLGFLPALVAYPLLYRWAAGRRRDGPRAWGAAVAAAAAGLQLGALGVVLQTAVSGLAGLPFRAFLLLMLPVHLAIGIVEGVATAAVVAFVARVRPEALASADAAPGGARPARLLAGILAAAAILGGAASWFASTHPDGLEWALARLPGGAAPEHAGTPLHDGMARVQARSAWFPGYAFREAAAAPDEALESWPAVDAGTSVAGLAGAAATLALAAAGGWLLRRRKAREASRGRALA